MAKPQVTRKVDLADDLFLVKFGNGVELRAHGWTGTTAQTLSQRFDEYMASRKLIGTESSSEIPWLSSTELWLLLLSIPISLIKLLFWYPILTTLKARPLPLSEIVAYLRVRAPPWLVGDALVSAIASQLTAVETSAGVGEMLVSNYSVEMLEALVNNAPGGRNLFNLGALPAPLKWAVGSMVDWIPFEAQNVPALVPAPAIYRALTMLRLAVGGSAADRMMSLALPDPFWLDELGDDETTQAVFLVLCNPSYDPRLWRWILQTSQKSVEWILALTEAAENSLRETVDRRDPTSQEWEPLLTGLGIRRWAAWRDVALHTDAPITQSTWILPAFRNTLLQWRQVGRNRPERRFARLLRLATSKFYEEISSYEGLTDWMSPASAILNAFPSQSLTLRSLAVFDDWPKEVYESDIGFLRQISAHRAATLVLRSRDLLSSRAFVRVWTQIKRDAMRAMQTDPIFITQDSLLPLPSAAGMEKWIKWSRDDWQQWGTLLLLLQLDCLLDLIAPADKTKTGVAWSRYVEKTGEQIIRLNGWNTTDFLPRVAAWIDQYATMELQAPRILETLQKAADKIYQEPKLTITATPWDAFPIESVSLADSPLVPPWRCQKPPRPPAEFAQAHLAHQRLVLEQQLKQVGIQLSGVASDTQKYIHLQQIAANLAKQLAAIPPP